MRERHGWNQLPRPNAPPARSTTRTVPPAAPVTVTCAEQLRVLTKTTTRFEDDAVALTVIACANSGATCASVNAFSCLPPRFGRNKPKGTLVRARPSIAFSAAGHARRRCGENSTGAVDDARRSFVRRETNGAGKVDVRSHYHIECEHIHRSEIGRTVVFDGAPFTIVLCTSLGPLPSVSMNILTTQNHAFP